MSHIIKAEPRFNNLDLLKEKVEEAGCFWIGARESVRVFNDVLKGTAFHVPDMAYPVVVTDDGEMIYETDSDSQILVGPYKVLGEIMRDYVLANIYTGAEDIARSSEDEMGTVHVDIKNGTKLLKFQVGLGGKIKADAEGYPGNTCVEDLNKIISGVPIVKEKKEPVCVENTV